MPVFPRRRTTSLATATVSSLVAWPRMTSTSCIIGTGFMKCSPMTFCGRFVNAPICVNDKLEVLLARIVCGAQVLSSSKNTPFFTSTFSFIASMTRSASTALSNSVVTVRRDSTAPFSSLERLPFSTALPRSLAIPAWARASASPDWSQSSTS